MLTIRFCLSSDIWILRYANSYVKSTPAPTQPAPNSLSAAHAHPRGSTSDIPINPNLLPNVDLSPCSSSTSSTLNTEELQLLNHFGVNASETCTLFENISTEEIKDDDEEMDMDDDSESCCFTQHNFYSELSNVALQNNTRSIRQKSVQRLSHEQKGIVNWEV